MNSIESFASFRLQTLIITATLCSLAICGNSSRALGLEAVFKPASISRKTSAAPNKPQTLVRKIASSSVPDPDNICWLDQLDLSYVSNEFGETHRARSIDGHAISVAGHQYLHGVGVHANSEFPIQLNGCAEKFDATIGIDSEVGKQGSVCFEVWTDGTCVFKSDKLTGGSNSLDISVSLKNVNFLVLVVDDGGDNMHFDHADWANARFTLNPGSSAKPVATSIPSVPEVFVKHQILFSKPEIHGARIIGASEGKPFLFLIPATGVAPLKYFAKNLPDGLTLDENSGVISGAIKSDGEYDVTLSVENSKGTTNSNLKVLCGRDKLAMTPPMGWNSWYAFRATVDAAEVKSAATALVDSGLAAHGYQYINIDDGWEGTRDEHGHIRANLKFPDMSGLSSFVHDKGLKLGIYSSPGPKTCQGLEGSYQHEADDAKTYESWGIDCLKYDLCSYMQMLPSYAEDELKKPYSTMAHALVNSKRDFLYMLCEYGIANVWWWGTDVHGNSWRTGTDIQDSWGSMSRFGFEGVERSKFAGPGHWNDPDMLMVGIMNGRAGVSGSPSRLTHNEQVTHLTLWSLLAAPLMVSCDLTKLDQFTTDLLSNDDMISVDQDPLGKAASRVLKDELCEVWSRPLSDGTLAVGLFNRSVTTHDVKATWSDLQVSGTQPVRDIWSQRDCGDYQNFYQASVPAHGAIFIRVGKPK